MRILLPFVLLLGVVPVHAQTVVPISAFVRGNMFSNPQISPDGKHLAVTVRIPDGKRRIPKLNFYSLPDLKLENSAGMEAFVVPVDYHWVSNTRLVLELGLEVGSREQPQATGEVVAMEFDGSRQKYLFGYKMSTSSPLGARYGNDHGYAWPVHFPVERNNHLYLGTQLWDSEQSFVYDFDSRSGVRRLVTSVAAPDATFTVQHDGVPRFAMSTDSANYSVVWRYDAPAEKWSLYQQKPGDKLGPVSFSEDNKEFIAYLEENGGPFKVVRENLATGARTLLAEDANGDIGGLMYASSRTLPVAARTSAGRPRTIYLQPDHPDAVVHRALSAHFPDSTISFSSATDDGSKMIAYASSDRDPGVYYLYDRKTGHAQELFVAMPDIDPEQMAERRPISFAARDGVQLDGYLTLPRQKGAAKPPLILVPHGGPHGVRDTWYFDTDAQFLANRGYAVLQVNFRGSGGKGDTFKQAGYRQWGGKILDDLVDGVQWAVAQGAVDGTRMCAYGASFGAYASLMLAAREPNLFKCAVGYAGVYEPALLFQRSDVRGDERLTSSYQRYLGNDAAELARYSPVQNAARIKAGVLLIHGGKDKRVPDEHAFKMKAALEKAGNRPEWYYVDYEGHGFYDTENQTEVYQRLEAFLGKYLGPTR